MLAHKHLPQNEKGRDFFFTDLHGTYSTLQIALDEVNFDPAADRLISGGDLIDRGPGNVDALNLLTEPWFHSVAGNHEQLMIDAVLHDRNELLWLHNGGTWAAYVDIDELKSLARLVDNKTSFTLTLETSYGPVGISHAEPPQNFTWSNISNLTEDELVHFLWARTCVEGDIPLNTKGVVSTFHGHTVVNRPKQLGNAFFLDTGSVRKDKGGYLTFFCIHDANKPYSCFPTPPRLTHPSSPSTSQN